MQGLPTNQKAIFPEKNLEHASWTLRASRKLKKGRLPGNGNLERYFHAALHLVCMVLEGELSICLVAAKQPSNTVTALQLTRSRSFLVLPQYNREIKLRGPNVNFEYFWEKMEPIHPLSDKVFKRPGL